MSGYNPDLYLNDAARREELARAEEILRKYRSRSSNVTTTTTTNVITEKPIISNVQKPTVGQKFHEEMGRNETNYSNERFSQGEYRNERVSRQVPQEDTWKSRNVNAEQDFYPATDSRFVSQHQYDKKVESPRREEFVDESRRSKSMTSPKKAGFMTKVKRLFKRGDKEPLSHPTTTAGTTTESFEDQRHSVRDDPCDVVYSMVKIQRWDDRSGLARDFSDEGFYTTLKMHRSSLFNRGLTKEHSIPSWLRRERILLDDIIDGPTRTHVKSMLGLSPRDNIRFESVDDPTALLNTSEVRPMNYSTTAGETSFRDRMYPDDRMYYPYSTWETSGPVQYSGKPRNILGIGDFKGEGMIQGTNPVSRLMRGTAEAFEHVVSGRRDFEERDHTILGRRDIDYPIKPDQYYNRNDEVFRGDDFIERDRIPKRDVYAGDLERREVRGTGDFDRRDVRTTEVDRDVDANERPGFMKRTVEGIKAAMHGNGEPEYDEGMKPSAGQQIKGAFKSAIISMKEGKKDHIEHEVDEPVAERRLEERESNRVYESNINKGTDVEETRPGFMKRTVEGIKAAVHGTKEPTYEEGMKPTKGQQIKGAIKSAIWTAKHPHEPIEAQVFEAEAMRGKDVDTMHNKERIVEPGFVESKNEGIRDKGIDVMHNKERIVETDFKKPILETDVVRDKGIDTMHNKERIVGAGVMGSNFDEGIRAKQNPVRSDIAHTKPSIGERIEEKIEGKILEKKAEMRGGDIYNEPVMTEYDPVVRKNDLADKGFHSGLHEHSNKKFYEGHESYNRGFEQGYGNSKRISDKFYDKGHPNYDAPVRYQ